MPATYSVVPTVSTGDWITSGWVNTYIGTNLAANWPGTAAGDMEYYLSAIEKAKLAKPSVNSVLKNTTTGVPSWLALTQIPGLLHAKNTIDFNPGGQSFAGSWADITGAAFNISLSHTCTVVVLAVVSGYNASAGRSFYIRASVNAVADSAPNPFFNGGEVRNEALPYIYYATGVTAGNRTVKLQCQADTDPNIVDRGRLLAFAFVE